MTDPRPHAFSRNADAALADPVLQAALSHAIPRLVEQRRAAVAADPGFEEARDAASRIKAEVLDNLDLHLERFIAEAEKRGARIHVARDDAQARDIAAGIAKEEGIALAVKGKSMAAREIDLNPALEAAGVSVVESDLGEYIVQLAGEPPSHIVSPAIHKTREQVARLFNVVLGEPYTEEIPALVGIARRRLRERLLAADMGITGANFLCADTGSVAIVTNGGNERIATTLPRVHLVLASIDKVIPRHADLPLFLRLLVRSAAGRPLSSYVSVLTGARRPGDAEGPERLHIVLVDNGRSAILQGKYRDILACIRCGACLNICPVYQSVGGHAYGWVYPGPMGSVLTPLLLGLPDNTALPDASTLCGACAEVCPVRIPLPDMLLALRSDARVQGLRTPGEVLGMKIHAGLMSRAGVLEALQRIAGVVSKLLWKNRSIAWLPWPLSGWTARRDLPAPAPQPFRRLWKKQRGIGLWDR
jgi:L-lactate dehydrogenase complex protein LldF